MNNYIYIVVHPMHPKWVKLGRTENLTSRIRQYQIGCPLRAYRYAFTIKCSDFEVLLIENCFNMDYEDEKSHEWFRIDKDTAINKIQDILNKDNIDLYIMRCEKFVSKNRIFKNLYHKDKEKQVHWLIRYRANRKCP